MARRRVWPHSRPPPSRCRPSPGAGKDPLQLNASRYRDTLEMHAQQIGQMQETQQLILQELHQVTTLLRAQEGNV